MGSNVQSKSFNSSMFSGSGKTSRLAAQQVQAGREEDVNGSVANLVPIVENVRSDTSRRERV